jgi:hypothetical protein
VALTRQGHELPNRSSAHGAVDKLGFGLDPASRMAIAELIRAERLESASIGSKHGVLEAFNGLRNGSLVARLSRQLRAETQGSRAECARACLDQMLASESYIVLLCDPNTWLRGLKRRGHHVGPWLRCDQARGQLRAAYVGASVSVRCWHGRSACSR